MCAFLHMLPDLSDASTEAQDQDSITIVTPAGTDEVASERNPSGSNVEVYVPNPQ